MTPKPSYLHFDATSRHVRLDPHEPAFVQDPYAAYAWLHGNAPGFYWENYGFWCFCRFDDVNRLLRDRRLGRERPGGYLANVGAQDGRGGLEAFDTIEAGSLLELEAPAHTRLRGLVNRAFVSRRIERLGPKIAALAHRLIDGMVQAGGGDLLADFALPLPATIIAEMMGVPGDSGPQLVSWSNDMVRMYMHAPSGDDAARANSSAAAFAGFISSHAALRRDRAGDDLLSVLVSAQADGQRLSRDELVSSAILILNAGHEATVHQIGNAVKAILDQRGDPRRFFASAAETAATVEECLRFDAPLHMFTRHVYEACTLPHGIALRPGDEIGLLLGAANRDPLAFEAAAAFDPSRPDQKNASFGAGIHFCIGASLARLELQIGLKALFERMPQMRLAEETRYRDTYHFHGLERVVVTT